MEEKREENEKEKEEEIDIQNNIITSWNSLNIF